MFSQIAKLARSLRVPGDVPENPSRVAKNQPFDKPIPDIKLENSIDDNEDDFDEDLESTEEQTTAKQNQEEEDEFEGGLC